MIAALAWHWTQPRTRQQRAVQLRVAPSLRGMRYRVLCLMRAAAAGEYILATEQWGGGRWRIEPFSVAGAPACQIAMSFVLEWGWIEPIGRHWVPGMVRLGLSESGREALDEANEWWASLSLPARFAVMAFE